MHEVFSKIRELGLERGIELLKFLPAEASGGAKMLAALHGPYASVSFMPTGGIDMSNLRSYLALPYVAAVGGVGWQKMNSFQPGGLTRSQIFARKPSRLRGTRGEARGTARTQQS